MLDLIRATQRAVCNLTSRHRPRLAVLGDLRSSQLRANLRGLIEGPASRLRGRVAVTAAPVPSSGAPPEVPGAPGQAAAPGLRPTRLEIVDIDDIPLEISSAHPAGGSYHALCLLVRVAGEPRGLVTLPFDGAAVLTAADIEPQLRPIRARAAAVPPVPQLRAAPHVTVILCSTFARLDGVRRCLDSLAALDYSAYDVVIVDNRAEPPALPAWLGAFPLVRVLHEPRPGLSAARNCGLAAAQGEIVAFTDDDVVVDRGWLNAIARRLEAHPDEAGVTGLILPAELETEAQATFEEYYGGFGPRIFQPVSHRLKHPPGRGGLRRATVAEVDDLGHELGTFLLYEFGHLGTGANMAFRTRVLRERGGFDVRLGVGTPTQGGEDANMFVRLIWDGHSLGYDPAALVHHSHRRDDAALRGQVATFGTSFTATLIALTLDDPRHLGAITATVPEGIRRMTRLFARRLRSEAPPDASRSPTSIAHPDLARLELLSMLKGPAAYIRSWRRARRPRS